jgi:SAM-dependent methyltransferase
VNLVKNLISRLANILQKIGFGQAVRSRRFNCHEQDSESWELRAQCATSLWLELLAEDCISNDTVVQVADFGCGDEKLRKILAARLGQTFAYHGYDSYPQAASVEHLDLEKGMPAAHFDVVFCLGLLEYLGDLDSFLERMRRVCRYAVVSFVISDSGAYSEQDARRRGWVSAYSRDQLANKLTHSGFLIRKFVLTNENKAGLWALESQNSDG